MDTPICLFVYNRPDKVSKTINSLINNYESKKFELFVFSDGPKNNEDVKLVNEVRKILGKIDHFKKIKIFENKQNKGLANSVISGVSFMFQKYNQLIVLEDDLISSSNFLPFMVNALEFYKSNKQIYSISGFTPQIKFPSSYSYDCYFSYRASSWGWATWKDRWLGIKWDLDFPLPIEQNKTERKRFNKGGADLYNMLINYKKGKIDSWAIRWVYNQFLVNGLSVYPKITKINNVGIGISASNTKNINYNIMTLDSSNDIEFRFPASPKINPQIERAFRNNYSLFNRGKNKFISIIKNLLNKLN